MSAPTPTPPKPPTTAPPAAAGHPTLVTILQDIDIALGVMATGGASIATVFPQAAIPLMALNGAKYLIEAAVNQLQATDDPTADEWTQLDNQEKVAFTTLKKVLGG